MTPAYDAALSAMSDLQYAVVDKSKDGITAKIFARTSDDKKIQVTLENNPPPSRKFRIRVGTFGDESLSRQILDKIKSTFSADLQNSHAGGDLLNKSR